MGQHFGSVYIKHLSSDLVCVELGENNGLAFISTVIYGRMPGILQTHVDLDKM